MLERQEPQEAPAMILRLAQLARYACGSLSNRRVQGRPVPRQPALSTKPDKPLGQKFK